MKQEHTSAESIIFTLLEVLGCGKDKFHTDDQLLNLASSIRSVKIHCVCRLMYHNSCILKYQKVW